MRIAAGVWMGRGSGNGGIENQLEKNYRKQRLETMEKQCESTIETEEGRLKKAKKIMKKEEKEGERSSLSCYDCCNSKLELRIS